METLSYETVINAPLHKVWDTLWNTETYAEWTQFFGPGSTMRSDWKVGGKTYFVDADNNGMVSTIDSLDKPNHVIFKHLGTVKNGVEDTESMEVKQWNGAFEKYILINLEGKTKLHAEVQVEKNFQDLMNNGFTKGLEIIKNIAERS